MEDYRYRQRIRSVAYREHEPQGQLYCRAGSQPPHLAIEQQLLERHAGRVQPRLDLLSFRQVHQVVGERGLPHRLIRQSQPEQSIRVVILMLFIPCAHFSSADIFVIPSAIVIDINKIPMLPEM